MWRLPALPARFSHPCIVVCVARVISSAQLLQYTFPVLLFQCLTMYVLAAALTARGRAGPVPQPPPSLFADEKAERESADFNEVGPTEDWRLMQRISKTNAFDPAADSEKRLVKEIEEFTRLVIQSVNGTEDAMTTEDGQPQDDDAAVTETDRDAASSDWTGGATWRYPRPQGSLDNGGAPSDRQEAAAADDDDGGNFEEIVKKISNDLKKLYVKIKQVMTVVKNWYALWNVANTVFVAAG